MKKQRLNKNSTLVAGLSIILLLFSTAAWRFAAPSDEPDSISNTDLIAEWSQDLLLTPEEIASLESDLLNEDDPIRGLGFLWHMAASLQQTLTDEQKAELLSILDTVPYRSWNPGMSLFRGSGYRWMQDGRFGAGRGYARQGRGIYGRYHAGRGYAGQGRMLGGRYSGGMWRFTTPLNLSDDQQSSVTAIRENYAEQYRELADQRRDDTLSADDFFEQTRTLRIAQQDELRNILTEEQRNQLGSGYGLFQNRRDEVTDVMIDVLELSDDQVGELKALRDSHFAEMLALRQEYQTDRGAIGDEVEALRNRHIDTMKDLLSETQYEIVQIHRALTIRGANRQVVRDQRQRAPRNRAPQRSVRRGRFGRR